MLRVIDPGLVFVLLSFWQSSQSLEKTVKSSPATSPTGLNTERASALLNQKTSTQASALTYCMRSPKSTLYRTP